MEIEDADFTEVEESTGTLERIYSEGRTRGERKAATSPRQQFTQKQKPFVINDMNGKPDENMIQMVMNIPSLSQDFKMSCLDAFVKQNYKWIEKRILNAASPEDGNVALQVQKLLRSQIKRDKKFIKRLSK